MSNHKSSLSVLTLAAIGVVFGDIGTSPLYALKECFHTAHGLLSLTEANVMGILSMIFWSIMLMVSIKYVVFIMGAHNNGEGGIMALLSLSLRSKTISERQKNFLITIGLFGAALFFGDGMITPAISVLSAVEGLTIVSPSFGKLVIPLAIGIITGLFLIQRSGTGTMGKFFGPLTLIWFICLGLLGLNGVIANPEILHFLNPVWALSFCINHPGLSFVLLGAVVLTITGGEALYADMGHFGRKPIVLGWVLVVLPCLMLNYAGQGALILQNPSAVANPFYLLVPELFMYPMIILATIATVIASQAVISGVFSIARQAMQLGYLPRLTVLHTSESEKGQIYIPLLNWVLFASVIVLVLLFKTSSNLAAAYGIAVTLTMLCDTILVSFVMYSLWKWSIPKVLLFFIPFFVLDCLFFGATSLKIMQGGWVPIVIGLATFAVMRTWKDGRAILFSKMRKDTMPLDLFVNSVGNSAHMISGTAIFMNSTIDTTPHALLHNLKHNKVLHSHNVITTVAIDDIPYVADSNRATITELSPQFWVATLRYGFKQQPDVPKALSQLLGSAGIPFDDMSASYFVSRERIIHTKGSGLAPWREHIFISMSRNTSSASDFFQIPSGRVIELGAQVEI